MKGLLFLLAVGFTASEKLDRTYLPPPGAKFAGGSPGDIQAPSELPRELNPAGTFIAQNGLPTFDDSQIETGINRGQPGLNDGTSKTPVTYYADNIPTTTTSYAFSQTTTLPPFETYRTTTAPINPVTGLPVQFPSQNPINFGYSRTLENKGQPGYSQNSIIPSGENSYNPGTERQPVQYNLPNFGQPQTQPGSQYEGQYQNDVLGSTQAPRLTYEVPSQKEQNLVIIDQPGVISEPSTALAQINSNYPQGTAIIQPGSTQYDVNVDRTISSFGPINSQNISPGQQVQNFNQPKPYNQPTYGLNQDQISSQLFPQSEGMKLISSNIYQPGSSTLTSPAYQNQFGTSSTTPMPGSFTSTSYPSSNVYKTRPERPQAKADRNAVIINFEITRTPNGYSYSYDTSNGIHADETGIVDNGTKARGGYSYTGDDGKIYSITYTADENGFQPRGDHLPTPPPIPEAIQKVIEQAAKDREAGIFDDGSYDESKYGDSSYPGSKGRIDSKTQDSYFVNTPSQEPHDNNGDILSDTEYQMSKTTNKDSMNFIPSQAAVNLRQESGINNGVENTNTALNFNTNNDGSPGQFPISEIVPSTVGFPQNVVYPGNQLSPITSQNKALNRVQENIVGDDTGLFNRPGEVTSTTLDGLDNRKEFRRPVDNGMFYENHKGNSKIEKNEYRTTTSPKSNDYGFDGSSNQYLPPQTKSGQNRFPSRVSTQTSSSTEKSVQFGTSKDSTARPFVTPNVNNNDSRVRQSYLANNPFVTPGGTTTTPERSNVSNNRNVAEIPFKTSESTSSPFQTTQATPRFNQYTPNYQYDVTQKVTPGSGKFDYSTISTTPMPVRSLQYGPVQSTRKPLNLEYRPSTTTAIPEISSQSPYVTGTPDYKFSSTGPDSGLSTTNLTPGSSPNSFTFGARLPINRKVTTSTNRPTDYVMSTAGSTGSTVGFTPSTVTSGPALSNTYETGYQYGPGISPLGYSTAPAGSKPSFTNVISSRPGMYSQVPPGSTYQSGYQYGAVPDLTEPSGSFNYPDSNVQPSPDRQKFSIDYQSGPQYKHASGLPSSTASTPGNFVLSDAPGSTPGYSTATYPGVGSQNPEVVDNFGRPIYTKQGSNPGYSTQGSDTPSESYLDSGDKKNQGNRPLSDSSSTDYYGPTDRPVGEDFSGPKQPQTFDPETGYHYK